MARPKKGLTSDALLKLFPREGSNQSKIFAVLKDQKWHCRQHGYEGKGISVRQVAGGGGIQGLHRKGFDIRPVNKFCNKCGVTTVWDRWTGGLSRASKPPALSSELSRRILRHYHYTDAIEQRRRPGHELIVDHRFPRIRYRDYAPPSDRDMSDEDLERHFQLLKKDRAGNHNLLKSRACEYCFKTGNRGSPFGIQFWYKGSSRWPANVPKSGAGARKGCFGCGWYNFDRWRRELNRRLGKSPGVK